MSRSPLSGVALDRRLNSMPNQHLKNSGGARPRKRSESVGNHMSRSHSNTLLDSENDGVFRLEATEKHKSIARAEADVDARSPSEQTMEKTSDPGANLQIYMISCEHLTVIPLSAQPSSSNMNSQGDQDETTDLEYSKLPKLDIAELNMHIQESISTTDPTGNAHGSNGETLERTKPNDQESEIPKREKAHQNQPGNASAPFRMPLKRNEVLPKSFEVADVGTGLHEATETDTKGSKATGSQQEMANSFVEAAMAALSSQPQEPLDLEEDLQEGKTMIQESIVENDQVPEGSKFKPVNEISIPSSSQELFKPSKSSQSSTGSAIVLLPLRRSRKPEPIKNSEATATKNKKSSQKSKTVSVRKTSRTLKRKIFHDDSLVPAKKLKEGHGVGTKSQTLEVTSSQVSRSQRLAVFFTSTTTVNRKENKLGLNKLAIRTARTIQESDVFCAGSDSSLKKTFHLLYALVLGKPIVSEDWLVDSLGQETLLDYDDYLKKDDAREQEWDCDISETSEKFRGDMKFFKGKTLIITSGLKSELEDYFYELQDILRYAGAKDVWSRSANMVEEDKNNIWLVKQDGDSELANLFGQRCFHKDFISLSILRGRLELSSAEFEIDFAKTKPSARKRRKLA